MVADTRGRLSLPAILTWLILIPACTESSPEGGTDGSEGSSGVMDSPLVADCELPSVGRACGAIRRCDSSGGSDSGGSPEPDAACEAENDAVRACVVAAGQARDAFQFSKSYLSDSGQYGTVVGFVVGEDGARSETEHDYEDLCAEVRAELRGPADLSGCDDFECVEDRFREADRVRSCGPEEQCGV